MGDKGERGVKNLKKWLTSFMKDLFGNSAIYRKYKSQ